MNLKLHKLLFILCFALGSQLALAQRAGISIPATFPAQLAWESMNMVEFNFKRPMTNLTPEQKLIFPAWKDELTNVAKYQQTFGNVLYAQRGTLLFSIFHAVGLCSDPASGAGAYDAYSVCPARVLVGNASAPTVFKFKDVCHYLQLNNPDQPLAKNHTEFAYDEGAKTAYLRVIQYGKFVPACNRAIQFE